MTEDTDYRLLVTVRLYGGGTIDEAAQALRDYTATFDLSGDREVEIINVRPELIIGKHPRQDGATYPLHD